jgi:hypothetical protein
MVRDRFTGRTSNSDPADRSGEAHLRDLSLHDGYIRSPWMALSNRQMWRNDGRSLSMCRFIQPVRARKPRSVSIRSPKGTESFFLPPHAAQCPEARARGVPRDSDLSIRYPGPIMSLQSKPCSNGTDAKFTRLKSRDTDPWILNFPLRVQGEPGNNPRHLEES